jgi:hypothetical protein
LTDTLDPEFNRILTQREKEIVADYEREHPDFFSAGTTNKEKIDYLKKIKKIRADEKMDRQKQFAKLDRAVEQKTTSTVTTGAAEQILKNGQFLKFCETAFAKVWLGDAHILNAVLLTAANGRVLNAKDGIHLHVTGTTQVGKSDSVKAALQFVHPYDRLIKTFSAKYLFYADSDLHPNTLVFSDDTVFEPETASLYRGMLTSWFSGVTRGTVVNHQKRDLRIPPRISLILTSVESVVLESDDGQDESRFLTLEVRRTPEQMRKIRQFIQQDHPDIKPDLETIYAAWNLIVPQSVKIHKTIDLDLPFREFKRYLTLCQAHALLCNRTETTDSDFLAIDQFLTYSKPMLNATTPAFTRKEAAVRSCLGERKKAIPDLVSETGCSIQDVYRALHGRDGTFQQPRGGLMQKEPRLEYVRENTPGVNDIHLFGLRK